MTYFPTEIWFLVCTQLWHQRDFGTLLNCARSGKQLAAIAVPNLYRIQDVAPIHRHDREGRRNPNIFLKRWAGIWRTILLSSLGKTLYPYSHYIRTLDLQNLECLLADYNFERGINKFFFHGELERFKVKYDVIRYNSERLDEVKTISSIGEAITKQTPLLEEFTGSSHLSYPLAEWVPRLAHMTHLKVWNGKSLKNIGASIRLHCPSFKGLSIQDWNDTDTDELLANLLLDLCPQSLESFENSAYHDYGPETFQALSSHGKSLNELKLEHLPTSSIPVIPLLKGCTNLVSLSLGAHKLHRIDLEKLHNDLFLEMVAWLKECKKLRMLTFTRFLSAPALMTPLLLDKSIRLTSLKYEGFVTRDTKTFHQALANQTSLRSLWLKEKVRKNALEPDVLIESLSKLVNLRELHLGESSNSFVDHQIVQLAGKLLKLEVWSTSGYRLTDAIWGTIATLSSLGKLEFGALMTFTSDGILDFIEKLGPGNKGLVLSLSRCTIPSAKRKMIQKIIAQKIDGKFGVRKTPDRDTDSYESLSDDFGDSDTPSFENDYEDDLEDDPQDDLEDAPQDDLEDDSQNGSEASPDESETEASSSRSNSN